jgi:hypothetical protein
MSNLVARILLSLFMVPLAVVVYLITVIYIANQMSWGSRGEFFIPVMGGLACWAFMAAYWTLLWFRQVKWNYRRRIGSALLVIAALAAGLVIALLLSGIEESIGAIFASIVTPILWLIGTVFLWKETRAERAARITATTRDAVTCTVCGYNLTGLNEARCPECGSKFTLNELFANQPSREATTSEQEISS